MPKRRLTERCERHLWWMRRLEVCSYPECHYEHHFPTFLFACLHSKFVVEIICLLSSPGFAPSTLIGDTNITTTGALGFNNTKRGWEVGIHDYAPLALVSHSPQQLVAPANYSSNATKTIVFFVALEVCVSSSQSSLDCARSENIFHCDCCTECLLRWGFAN